MCGRSGPVSTRASQRRAPSAYCPASTAKGTQLVWVGRDGERESVIETWRVFNSPRISPVGERIAVEVWEGDDREVLFNNERFWAGGLTPQYDLDPNGQRFLMLDTFSEDTGRATIHVVQNWFEELEGLVPNK